MKKVSKMIVKGLFYYKSCCVYDKETRKKTQYPVKLAPTTQSELALERKIAVENVFNQLKHSGIPHKIKDYQFPWFDKDGKVGFKPPLTFKEGYDIFIDKRRVSPSTMAINIQCLNHWMKYLSGIIPIEEITRKYLIQYVEEQQDNGRSDTSINMDLRTLRTMLLYLKDIDKVSSTPSFKKAMTMCPVNDEDPIYITENEFIDIMNGEWCLLHTAKRIYYKRVFQMYWDLGLRLREPFLSTIQGNYLCIPKLKKGRVRKVRLTDEHKLIIEEMHSNYKKRPTRDHMMHYSKVFKKALRYCDIEEIKHFHCLRHSYALRRRIETNGNLQLVAIEMGHKSYKTTEKYQRCDEHLLADDFPSLRHLIESVENGSNNIHSTKKTSTKSYSEQYNSPREMN